MLAVVWGLGHFQFYIYGKPIELLTGHQALEPLIKRNKSNKTYSARLTRWLDRLAHFDNKIKHIAGKHLALTDYLSRHPISKPEPIENYNEEYVINCVIPLAEFINNHGSITDEKNTEAQTDKPITPHTNSQSQTRTVIEPPLNKNKQTERSQSTAISNSVTTDKVHYLKNNYHKDKMDHKIIETIKKEDPSIETLQLTKRWREISKPGDYRFFQGQWRKYNPPRTERSELKRIEMELWQRRNRILWQRMERSNQETQEETERKREFHRVIDKIRNLQKKRDEAGPSTSKNTGSVEEETMPELQSEETEIVSSDSDKTIAVPAILFKRYLGTTGVRYIQMGKASKIQNSEE